MTNQPVRTVKFVDAFERSIWQRELHWKRGPSRILTYCGQAAAGQVQLPPLQDFGTKNFRRNTLSHGKDRQQGLRRAPGSRAGKAHDGDLTRAQWDWRLLMTTTKLLRQGNPLQILYNRSDAKSSELTAKRHAK